VRKAVITSGQSGGPWWAKTLLLLAQVQGVGAV